MSANNPHTSMACDRCGRQRPGSLEECEQCGLGGCCECLIYEQGEAEPGTGYRESAYFCGTCSEQPAANPICLHDAYDEVGVNF